MSSGLFIKDNSQIRSEYAELWAPGATSIPPSAALLPLTAIDSSTSKRLLKTSQESKILYIHNGMNVELDIWVVATDPNRSKQRWMSIGPGQAFNFDLASNNLLLEAGTEIYVSYSGGGTALSYANTRIRLFTWG